MQLKKEDEKNKEKILNLSFYTTLDFLDEINNINESERYMKIEKTKYLTKLDGLEKWIKQRDRQELL